MTTSFTENGWSDYIFWQENTPEIVKRINVLIKDIKRDIFSGLGKPEPLRGNFAGYWSRRITDEHRLVYRIHGAKPDQFDTIIQLRFHYQ